MDERLDQCSDKSASETNSSEMARCNQEVPEDLKKQQTANSEARKVGKTPSSLDLPKIDMADFLKWESVACQNKPQLPEQSSPESQVCSEKADVKPPAEPQGCERPASTQADEQGRTVREKYTSGPDVVVAYDEKGEPHRFRDEPIQKMPPDFRQIPEWRQKQLDQESKDLIEKYAGPKTAGEYEKLDFQKIADLQKDIAQRQDLTEAEKCLLYTDAQQIMHDKPIPISNWNEKPEMVDSWTGERDPWHAVAPLDDRYHNRLVNMSPEDASKAIFEQENETEGDMHESWAGRTAWKIARAAFGINEGDINASEGQLKAMRQMREKGTFAAYANEWEKQFVNKDGVNPQGGTV